MLGLEREWPELFEAMLDRLGRKGNDRHGFEAGRQRRIAAMRSRMR